MAKVAGSRQPGKKGLRPEPVQPQAAPSAWLTEAQRWGLAGCMVVAYLAGLGLRLYQWPRLQGAFGVAGDPLLATHDAYGWLANAVGVHPYLSGLMPGLAKTLAAVTGTGLDTVAFWVPAFISPLAGLPVVWLAWRLGLGFMAATAGAMACLGAGYLSRTWLGYYDTDIVTLLFPALEAALAAAWLSSLRPSDTSPEPEAGESEVPGATSRRSIVYPVLLAATCWLDVLIYISNAPVVASVLALTGLVGLIFCRGQDRWRVVAGVMLAAMATFGGFWGVVAAGLAAAAMVWRPELLANRRFILGLGAALVVFLTINQRVAMSQVFSRFEYWSTGSQGVRNEAGLQLPSVLSSVREARKLDLATVAVYCANHIVLLVASLVGYAALAWRHPSVLVFLPLWGLGLVSGTLGSRFSMYAAPAVGLGLAGLAALLRPRLRLGAAGAVLLVVSLTATIWTAQIFARYYPLTPVLPQIYADTLEKLGPKIEPNACLWTWWDYGYAAQYYARRVTVADGGRNESRSLLAVSLVHATPDRAQAAGVMRQVAASLAAGESPLPWGKDPLAFLAGLSPTQARDSVAQAASLPLPQVPPPPQYLVLSWENIKLSYWICHFGLMDVATGVGPKPSFQWLPGKTDTDLQQGRVVTAQGSLEVSEIISVGKERIEKRAWNRPGAPVALVNSLSRELYLLDPMLARSMMVRMLLEDPATFADQFELVVDLSPWNRVYRLRPTPALATRPSVQPTPPASQPMAPAPQPQPQGAGNPPS